jgi:hypothetical protein
VTLSSLIASRAFGGGADISSEATASGLSRLLEPGVARLKVSSVCELIGGDCGLT